MRTTTIKAIFTNLLFVIGVILMVIGFTNGVSTFVRTVMFDEYPLQRYEEIECETKTVQRALSPEDVTAPVSVGDTQKCFDRLEQSRKVNQVEDITNSISFFVAGSVLAFAFKRFIFSKEK